MSMYLILAIPVVGHEVHHRQRRIITRNHLRQMVPRPRIAVVVNPRDVLVSRDFVDRQRTPNRSTAAGCPSGHSSAAC